MKRATRENYMIGLRNAMRWHYSGRETALTLEDVDSIFEEGGKRGRTEQEIAEELGMPEDFVLALAREGGPLPKGTVLLKKLFAMLVLAVIIIYLVMMGSHMLGINDAGRNHLVICAAAVCVPALIYFVAGGNGLHCAGTQAVRVRRQYLLCLLVSVLLVGYEQFVLVWACRSVQAPVAESYSVIRVLIAVGIILLFVLAVRLFRGDSWCIGLFSTIFGAVGSSVSWVDFAKRFDACPQNPWTCICVFPCVIGILFAVILYQWNKIRGKMP